MRMLRVAGRGHKGESNTSRSGNVGITAPVAMERLEERVLLSLLGEQLYPADNPWNQKVTQAPVAANSAAIMASIVGAYGDGRLHPDFGQDGRTANDLYGIPYNVVHGNTVAKVHVVIDDYPGESDLKDVPIPANAVIEGDIQNAPTVGLGNRGDSHLLIWDEDNNVAYEFYQASRPSENADGKWHAGGETVWDMKTNTFRPLGWTSADAAGLSVLAGLVRPDEALPVSQGGQGVIKHAIRFTLQNQVILNQFIYPASHVANPGNNNPGIQPPMGARFRLKASVDISKLNPEARVVAQAMKDYGMILADNGSNFYFSGASYSVDANNQVALTWDDNDIQDSTHGLKSLHYSDFEVVDLTPAVTAVSPASGAAGTVVTITGRNFTGAAGHLQVLFGSTGASAVTVLDDGHLTAVAPTCSGTVDVRVRSGVSDPNDSQNISSPTFGYGTSATSSADQFTAGAGAIVDSTPPTVTGLRFNHGGVQRSMINRMTLSFSEPVSVSSTAILLLTSTGAPVSGVDVAVANPSGDGRSYVLSFSGSAVIAASLPDGLYRLKVRPGQVHDLAGNAMAGGYSSYFHRLFGDADGDKDVDAADRAAFNAAMISPASYQWYFDYDGDGRIDDLLQFKARRQNPSPL